MATAMYNTPTEDRRAYYQEMADLARKFCSGELPEEEVNRLPWDQPWFLKTIGQQLRNTVEEVKAHRVRFKALREVFGP